MRILLVEDDLLLAQGLSTALTRINYRVELCTTGKQAIQAASESQFELMILDLGLPDGLALNVIKSLRNLKHGIPILILTAWDHLETKIEALNAGADDYVLKPCDSREIEARLRVLVRRHQQRQLDQLQCADLTMDLTVHECRYQDRLIYLTTREFLLLKEFMLHQGKILSRQHLEELSNGWTGETESNSIEVHIHNLRKKTKPECIKTIRGIGYMMVNQYED
ncbi:response regulator [Rheinheimera mangrovi]|uniref:response regulator n=1 Tax=Rheinheimera mangrovi TaxID=2498451 RepID=UPI000F8CA295|nr:response regulator transcription factor [Rheinheimera mangrovi]